MFKLPDLSGVLSTESQTDVPAPAPGSTPGPAPAAQAAQAAQAALASIRSVGFLSGGRPTADASGPSGAEKSDDDDEDFFGPAIPSGLTTTAARPSASVEPGPGPPEEPPKDEKSGKRRRKRRSDAPPAVRLPLANVLALPAGDKSVQCIVADGPGSRTLTGGFDREIRFWPLDPIPPSLAPRYVLNPFDLQAVESSHRLAIGAGEESAPIRDMDLGPDGALLAVAPAAVRARIIDVRQRGAVWTTPRGDMYIRDRAHTKGHVASITSIQWNPINREEFVTSSEDGTVRTWSMVVPRAQKRVIVLRASTGAAHTIRANQVRYSVDGTRLAVATNLGEARIYSATGQGHRPDIVFEDAYTFGDEHTAIAWPNAPGEHYLATRGMDSIKLWDIRNPSKPVADRPTPEYAATVKFLAHCPIAFSPNDTMLAAGGLAGTVDVLAVPDLRVLGSSPAIDEDLSPVVSVLWHQRLNQIFAGCQSGRAGILFDPSCSVRGALTYTGTPARPRRMEAVVSADTGAIDRTRIVAPDALPLFRDEHSQQARAAARAQAKPAKPPKALGRARGGQAGAISNTHFAHFVAQSLQTGQPDAGNFDDPREALLRHAKEAEENPIYTAVYQKNQAVPIFQEPESDEEGEGGDRKRRATAGGFAFPSWAGPEEPDQADGGR